MLYITYTSMCLDHLLAVTFVESAVPALGEMNFMTSQNVSPSFQPLTLLAAVDELSGVDALSCDEELCPLLEAVGVTESYFGQGGATAGVMDDILREGNTVPSRCIFLPQPQRLLPKYHHLPSQSP